MGSEVLFSFLQDLRDDELRKFLWFLTMSDALDEYETINERQLLRENMWETVDLMVKAYTPDGALKVTKNILEKMNRKDLVQKLPGTSSGPAVDSTEVEIIDEAPAATTSSNLRAPHPRQEAPTLQEQIITAVAESRERWGLSQPALEQVLAAKGVDVATSNNHINTVTSNLVHEGTLTQTSGNGIVFFKLNAEAVKKTTAAAKTAARKAAAAEKAAAAKREAAKEAAVKAAEAEEDAAMKKADAEEAAEAETVAMAAKEAADKKAEVIKKAAAIKRATAAVEKAETAFKRAAVATQKVGAAGGQWFSPPFNP
ncbi:histone H1-like [Pempheris klunzingeri]|uniref:histone H1-like n=1 Tax=Pempheris klunzingeri TaxID=3127111 RepID=UPI00397FF47F